MLLKIILLRFDEQLSSLVDFFPTERPETSSGATIEGSILILHQLAQTNGSS